MDSEAIIAPETRPTLPQTLPARLLLSIQVPHCASALNTGPSTAILAGWVSWFRVETADIDADPREAGVTCYARIHSRIPTRRDLRKSSTAVAHM